MSKMKISKEKFFLEGSVLNLSQEQLEAFWKRLEIKEQKSPFSIYLFYFGTLIIISSLAWFLNLGYEFFGKQGLFLIGLAYILLFTSFGHLLWNKKELKTVGGLFITIAVSMVPLTLYGMESRWIYMEIGTILAGLIALWFYPFPFLTAPIFFATWLLSINIPTYIMGDEITGDQKSWVTIYFGLTVLLISIILDKYKKNSYAFWGYIFGTLAFWMGVNLLLWNNEEPYLFFYLLINLLLMGISFLLRRTVLMVFGALGVFIFLSYITYGIFREWVFFPIILTLIGLGIIYIGILYQKNRQWVEEKIADLFKFR